MEWTTSRLHRHRRTIAAALTVALIASSIIASGESDAVASTGLTAIADPARAISTSGSSDPDQAAPTKTITRATTFTASDGVWHGAGDDTVVVELFDESFGEEGSWGSISRTCFSIEGVFSECARIGAEIEASIAGSMSMSLELGGLSGGTVEITYPITVTFTAPEDNSFDPGDEVTIGTAFEVDHERASITVDHPELDAFTIDTELGFAMRADYDLCYFKCERGTLVDDVGTTAFPVLFLDDDTIGFTRGCFDGLEFLPISIALGLTEYPNERCANKGYVFDPSVDLTTEVTEDGGLRAVGSDTFSVFPVSLMTWALRFTPLPFWAVVNLDPVRFEGIELGYTTFNVVSTALTTMHQDLRFEPDVEIDLDWGRDLEFRVGDDGEWGRGSTASLLAGEDVHLRTDASTSSVLDVRPTVHLRDTDVHDVSTLETVGDLRYTALSFDVETPRWRECFGDLGCETIVPGRSYRWGPLLNRHVPIGSDDDTVLFDGAYPVLVDEPTVEFESFTIVPRPRVEIHSELRPVNAPGSFDLLLGDEVVAADVGHGGTSGPVVLDPGNHEISVVNGPGGDLMYYDTHVRCVHRADEHESHTERTQIRTATVAEATSTFAIDLTGGEDLICVVLIRLPVPWECDAMAFDHVILGDPRTDASELLRGTTARDIIVGYGGSDTIISGPGDDCVAGGTGDDLIVLGPGNNVADGGPGDDLIIGGPGDEILRGGTGTDRINGGGGDDVIEEGSLTTSTR